MIEYELPAQPGYPWPLLLRTRGRSSADGLRVDHEVTNIGAEAAPFGLAAHPYLRLPGVAVDDLVLTVPGRSRVLVDGRLLPIGAAKVAGSEYDFTGPGGSARRCWTPRSATSTGTPTAARRSASPAAARTLRVWADEAFGWWQVFTGDTLHGDRHRRSVAVEPMTCPPDAFRSGQDVIVLEPGDTWRRPGASESRWTDSPAGR